MESHTRVTYRRNPGFLERIGQSLIGILVGIVLLIVASCLLFWNEVTLHYVTFNGKTMYLALWGRGGGYLKCFHDTLYNLEHANDLQEVCILISNSCHAYPVDKFKIFCIIYMQSKLV